MPYVDNSGVSIHYHVEGDGPPLVLQHGLTSSLRNWYAYGFVEELQKDYRVIMVDARGHGRSGKPHDPKDYDLKLRVNDVLAVMDDLGVSKAHYMGYSMGGRIGFGIVLHALDRFHSLVIGGVSANTANSDVPPEDRISLLRQGMAQYVADAEANEGPMESGRRERLLGSTRPPQNMARCRGRRLSNPPSRLQLRESRLIAVQRTLGRASQSVRRLHHG